MKPAPNTVTRQKPAAKNGNLQRLCTGAGSKARFINVWSN